MLLVHAPEGQFEHADHGIHWRTDLMAHGSEECAFGAVGLIRLLFGCPQVFEQLTAFADVDPAADDAFHITTGIAIGNDPVIDRQTSAADVQGPVEQQRNAFSDDSLVIGVEGLSLESVAYGTLHDAFANDILALGIERFEVTVIAALQQPLAVANVDRVRCAVDQRAHEFALVAEGSLRGLALFDLVAHVGVPRQQ